MVDLGIFSNVRLQDVRLRYAELRSSQIDFEIVVLRPPHCEALDRVSRELGLTVARLAVR